MGLCSRRPIRVPLLTKRHHQLRLQWAREHRDWTMDEWKRAAWSYKSRFLIHHVDGRIRQDNAPCHKAQIVLELFEEHTDEYHLMSWPPNSTDHNSMEHIWDVIERQLRAQTPPYPNISTLRDRCLDIWYNQSHVKNLWHRCPGELQLF
ncbi:hypothetical protein AVEN_44011-1 [Araneus ventricosus]|uniref:Tc1-like transposase DDE domain-containing protein n=1 Tax=Araneus ventricosus TaxID=182803 RepID=A0A4Y2R7Z9_ARAVE|nr:hypothetical protein AVEN_44011-1 [Araneus ventricosus]